MRPAGLTYDIVKSVILSKSYKFFEGDLNLNFIGIRTKNMQVDHWDDIFCMLWQEHGNHIWINPEFTTDPGIYYMQQKILSPKGCGILAPGQYPHIWTIGLHLNKYRAFVETGGPVTVYRDRNKNNIMDFDPNTLETGYFGCNMHHGYNTINVENNSAMCQVHRHPEDLATVLDIAALSTSLHGPNFTYTLLQEADF